MIGVVGGVFAARDEIHRDRAQEAKDDVILARLRKRIEADDGAAA